MPKSPLIRGLIIAFCLWHMFAIGVYSIAEDLEEAAATWLNKKIVATGHCPGNTKPGREKLRDKGKLDGGEEFEPSAFEDKLIKAGLCSKPIEKQYEFKKRWQRTIRRKVRPYLLITGQWQRWNLFSPDPLRRNSTYLMDVEVGEDEWRTFKIITPNKVQWWRRAFTLKTMRRLEQEDKHGPIRDRFLQLHCMLEGIRPGRKVRMRKKYFVLEKTPALSDPEYWAEWEPEWKEKPFGEATCPETLN